MNIVSWNVNGFRACIKSGKFQEMMDIIDPDIILLQEIKCTRSQLVREFNEFVNPLIEYRITVTESNIPGRHGVAAIIKEEIAETFDFKFYNYPVMVDGKDEGRIQMFSLQDLLFLNVYSVNVRPDLSRVPQRVDFDKHIPFLVNNWYRGYGNKVLVFGDLNVVSEAEDYHGGYIKSKTAGMTDEERNAFHELLDTCNLVDTYRHFNPNERGYSYWSYRGNARENNLGWRIDYCLANQDIVRHLEEVAIEEAQGGSDHAPILVTLSEEVFE